MHSTEANAAPSPPDDIIIKFDESSPKPAMPVFATVAESAKASGRSSSPETSMLEAGSEPHSWPHEPEPEVDLQRDLALGPTVSPTLDLDPAQSPDVRLWGEPEPEPEPVLLGQQLGQQQVEKSQSLTSDKSEITQKIAAELATMRESFADSKYFGINGAFSMMLQRRRASRFKHWHTSPFIFRLPRGNQSCATLAYVDDEEMGGEKSFQLERCVKITSNKLERRHFELHGQDDEYELELRAADASDFAIVMAIFAELGQRGLLANGNDGQLQVTTDQDIMIRIQEEIQHLQHDAKREMLRLLMNSRKKAKGNADTQAQYLRNLARGDNMNYEVLPGTLEQAQTFDVVLFREYTAVSNLLARIQRIHGSDLFSHVGIVLRPPVLPESGRYLPSNDVAQAGEFGNIPFIKLRIKIEESGTGAGDGEYATGTGVIVVTAVSVKRLPDRLDEGGMSQDPYVKIGLEPWCEGLYADEETLLAREGIVENDITTAATEGVREGHIVRTCTMWNAGSNVDFTDDFPEDNGFEMRIPFPRDADGATSLLLTYNKLRIEVWDDDHLSPDDLIARTYLHLTAKKMQEFSDSETTVWLPLGVLDDGEDTKENFVTLPRIRTIAQENDAQSHLSHNDKLNRYLQSHLRHAEHQAEAPIEITGQLLVAPLGRSYRKLFVGERVHRSCRARTYRRFFTMRFLAVESIAIMWMLANYIYFFNSYQSLFSGCVVHHGHNSKGHSVGVHGPCIDSPNFADENGQPCNAWIGRACNESMDASGGLQYTAAGLAAVTGNCTKACGGCETLVQVLCQGKEILKCEEAECISWRIDRIVSAQMRVYYHVVDWIVVALFSTVLVMRWVCTSCEEFCCNCWNWLDLAAVIVDVWLTVNSYQAIDISELENLRMAKCYRILLLLTSRYRIAGFNKNPWILRKVTVSMNQDVGQVEVTVSGSQQSGSSGKGPCRCLHDFDKERNFYTDYVIDHRLDVANYDFHLSQFVPVEEARPARVLDRITHIINAQNQSNFCLYVPVKAKARPQRHILMQLDAKSEAVRDVWINGINKMYRNSVRQTTVDCTLNSETDVLQNPTPRSLQPTSMQHTQEFALEPQTQIFDEDKVFVWESSASGTLLCCVKISRTLDEETKKGALGVQIRNLQSLVDEYDGEVVIVKLHRAWRQKRGDLMAELLQDRVAREHFQQHVTRLHRLFYQRAYSCNCLLCVATICGNEGCCGESCNRCGFCAAKYSSRICNSCICCLCGRRLRELFREDGVKCSQLVANLYQGLGLMDPEVNPSKVLPIDFLPAHYRYHREVDDESSGRAKRGRDGSHRLSGGESHSAVAGPGQTIGQSFTTQKKEALSSFYAGFPMMGALIPVKVKKDDSSGYRTAEEASDAYLRRLNGLLDDRQDCIDETKLVTARSVINSRMDVLERPERTLSRGTMARRHKAFKKIAQRGAIFSTHRP